jgi:hypothetical protein
MNRKTWTILLGIMAAGLLSQQVQAQSYSPYTPPTIGDIQTMCVELTPLPRDRTDVGIGEQVYCWIDTSTWNDTDIGADPYGNQWYMSDTLGSITWSVSGPASISPTMTYDSTPVTLTIDLADADGSVLVMASVKDSGTLGVDAAVPKAKGLNAKIPTGCVILTATDQPNPAWKPGNANLGASTTFLFQVQPGIVNLNEVNMQIAFAGLGNYIWPDGTKDPIAPSTDGPWKTQSVNGTPNLHSFFVTQELVPIAIIAGGNWNFTNAGSLQYQDKNGIWKGGGGNSRLSSIFRE